MKLKKGIPVIDQGNKLGFGEVDSEVTLFQRL